MYQFNFPAFNNFYNEMSSTTKKDYASQDSYGYKPSFVKGFKRVQSSEDFFDLTVGLIADPSAVAKKNYSAGDLPNEYYAQMQYENNRKQMGSGLKRRANEADFKAKYKTEPCKYWESKQSCPFGDQCAFAHGTVEIRDKIHVSTNYKTKKCVQYHENLYCPYGKRCQFLHSVRSLNLQQSGPISFQKQIENPELLIINETDCMCLTRQLRPRLPVFADITRPDCEEEKPCSSSHVCSH